MIVNDILHAKGSRVVTIALTASISELVAELARERIGAAVVAGEGRRLDGIVSERDIARGLAEHGSALLDLPVAVIMTTDVATCAPTSDVAAVARTMTTGRFRHLPVVDDGNLIGIVSIGDVVKARIDQLETEADQLMDYLASP